jgi:uncharacterized protein YoxC
MSNPKKAIAEIKNLMKQFGFLADDQAVLKSFKLEDNTILETSDLKVGEKITKLNEEFERVALESGKYRLVENFSIEVTDGEIVAVKEIFMDAKLVDGTIVKVSGEELIEGAEVKVVTDEAEIMAPDGTHELSDGTKIETKDGIIVKIETMMEEVEIPEEEVDLPAEEVELPEEAMKQIYSLLEEMMKKVSEKMKNMEQKMESMSAEFSAYKSEPAGKPIPNGKSEFSRNDNNLEESRINAILQLRKK